MKTFKIIFIAGIGLLFVYLVLCFMMPKDFKVERSMAINASVESVFEEVNDFNNMHHWSPWKDYDPNMTIIINGKINDPDYKYSWKSEHDKVGHGSISRKLSEPNKKISNDLFFDEFNMHSNIDWAFEPIAEGGTKTTWTNSGTMPFLMRPLISKMESMMAPDMEKGLQLLKQYCEAKPKPLVNNINIELTDVQGFYYLALRDTATMSTISQKMGMAYQQIGESIAKQKLSMAGYPFAIYYNTPDATTMDLAIGLPVDKSAKNDGKLKADAIKEGKAVVAHYFGSYQQLGKAHTAILQWIAANNKIVIGAPWEIYITDPMMEKDTAKWQTDVYYRLE